MIGQYTLELLCNKYGISAEKLVKKNNNILDYGEYQEIDRTLNYLINELRIAPINIEKCPSILYRNVEAIKHNVEFLKKMEVHFSNIESCLHVLSKENEELIETYKYVINNYGVSAINRNTSILSVNIDIIMTVEKLCLPIPKEGNLAIANGIEWGNTTIEEVQKIIQSPEFKEHPELFTSETLAHAKLEEIQKIIQSEEFKSHPELFTSETIAHTKLEEIQKIIQSEEFKSHPEMFTSTTIAHAKLEEIQKIIQSEEFKSHPEMFTSTTIAYAKLEEIQKIIQSPEFKDHPELFTSETLAYAKLEEIQKIIQSPEFKEHPELFTSQTIAHAKLEEIQKIIKSPEFKEHPELFTSQTLARAKLDEIQKIIKSPEFKDHPELFTSQTIAHAKLEEIQGLLKLECWKDERFKNLLTSSIVANSKKMISKLPIQIQIAELYSIDKYLSTSFLLFSPSQNYAKIQYLKEHNIPLVSNEKLNPIFGLQPGTIKKKYGIDINELIIKYPLNIEEIKNMDGGKKL